MKNNSKRPETIDPDQLVDRDIKPQHPLNLPKDLTEEIQKHLRSITCIAPEKEYTGTKRFFNKIGSRLNPFHKNTKVLKSEKYISAGELVGKLTGIEVTRETLGNERIMQGVLWTAHDEKGNPTKGIYLSGPSKYIQTSKDFNLVVKYGDNIFAYKDIKPGDILSLSESPQPRLP